MTFRITFKDAAGTPHTRIETGDCDTLMDAAYDDGAMVLSMQVLP